MRISEELLDRARRLDRQAAEAVLAASYPAVYRIAHALACEPQAAQKVIQLVLRRAARVLPTWRTGAIPENWFYHHTVLTARQFANRPATSVQDPLMPPGETVGPDYLAFLSAVRRLPPQQAEAFLLNHGEKLNPRLLGVAMDCSMRAAKTHLDAADEALAMMAGVEMPAHTARLSRAYAALTPHPAAASVAVRLPVTHAIRTRRARRFIRLLASLIVLAILTLLTWAAWRWRHHLPLGLPIIR